MAQNPIDPKLEMSTAWPTAKLMAAGVAALLGPILLYIITTAFPDVPLPQNAGDLVESIVQGLIFALFTVGAGYVKAPAARDVPVAVEKPPPVE